MAVRTHQRRRSGQASSRPLIGPASISGINAKSADDGSVKKDKLSGWLLGGFAGYGYQLPSSGFVLGAETDFSYADVDKRTIFYDPVALRPVALGRMTDRINWTGATRARLGYSFGRLLVYGAAGVAYQERERTVRGRLGLSLAPERATPDLGWTIGSGMEIKLLDNLAGRVEYRHTNYGSEVRQFSAGPIRFDQRTKWTDDRVMTGLAYRFN